VISVAFKIPVKTRLESCIYKTLLLHRPDDYGGFTPSCSPSPVATGALGDLASPNKTSSPPKIEL